METEVNSVGNFTALESCFSSCKGDGKMFSLTNSGCVNKADLCDFTEDFNLLSQFMVCMIGPSFPDWEVNH